MLENVIDIDLDEPATAKPPLDGDALYCLLVADMVYEYVPLGSEKDIDVPVPENDCPLVRFTYHVVPEERPVSVNVTLYVTSENVTV